MRVEGWQSKLNQYLLSVQENYKRSGLVWGQLDCVHYVADWVLLCTGTDPLEQHRNKYMTEEEAFLRLTTYEGSLLEALRKRFVEAHPSHAHRGDIAFHEELNALGIFFTSGSKMRALFLGRKGFALHKGTECTHAFHVGDNT